MSKYYVREAFGAHLLKNSHAKCARPLASSALMRVHLLMRHGRDFKLSKDMKTFIKSVAAKHRVQMRQVIWKQQTLQMVIKLTRKKRYSGFIRALSGSLALLVSRASKNRPLTESFWLGRPWTCILESNSTGLSLLKITDKVYRESLQALQFVKKALGP